MTFNGWLQISAVCRFGGLLTKPMGGYMTRVFAGERTLLPHRTACNQDRHLQGVWCRRAGKRPQHWISYAIAMLTFSFAGFVIMYGIQRLQNVLPLNPQGQDAADRFCRE